MEIFTPWTWKTGMWETLHLFSRYNLDYYVPGSSDLEEFVSAYPSINEAADSMTLVLVNRSENEARKVEVRVEDFMLEDGYYLSRELAGLPGSETFLSHTSNALHSDSVLVRDNVFVIDLEALSIVSLSLSELSSPFIGVEAVNISKEGNSDTIQISDSLQFFATLVPENASLQNVLWSVSDHTLASIKQDGLMMALGEGEVWVKAETEDGKLGDSLKIVIEAPVRIEAILNPGLKVYPNPVTGGKLGLSFQHHMEGEVFISLMDIRGQEIKTLFKQNLAEGRVDLNLTLPAYPDGIYILRVSLNGSTFYHKLILAE